VEDGESKKEVMDDLGLERPCCRNMFLTHVDLQETASHFKKS
jgi:DNA-directed RNA polymerase subunit N